MSIAATGDAVREPAGGDRGGAARLCAQREVTDGAGSLLRASFRREELAVADGVGRALIVPDST